MKGVVKTRRPSSEWGFCTSILNFEASVLLAIQVSQETSPGWLIDAWVSCSVALIEVLVKPGQGTSLSESRLTSPLVFVFIP